MKKVILALSLVIAGTAVCLAQCEKKSVITTSQTNYLDGKAVLQRSEDEQSRIEVNKTDLTIIPGNNDDHKMTGPITANTCDWTTPFKEGRSVIKATLSDQNGDQKKVTLTIEGKGGKVTATLEVEGMDDKKIQVVADKFEERS